MKLKKIGEYLILRSKFNFDMMNGKKNPTDVLPDANNGNCLSVSPTVESLTLHDKANKTDLKYNW